MCGIAGYIGRRPLDQCQIDKTLVAMRRRGPDGQAFRNFQIGDLFVTFLHARLSIIDLDERSSQPFQIGDYHLTFNGEIYNYLELRQELERRNIALRTTSDTEILLHYYILFGERCVDYFEGMWSFAILDKKKQCLFLSRDRFGEKPLYYIQNDSGIYFGSEVKFLTSLSQQKLVVNDSQILRYLVNGYKSIYKTQERFFKDLKEVSWASNLKIDSQLNTKSWRYWEPRVDINPNMSLQEAVDGFREHFMRSVNIRLRADVPLAFCLSGGVDSAAMASVAAKQFGYKVSTFSILDKDWRFNEYDNIKATIDDLGCEHQLIELSTSNFFERLRALVSYHDSPLVTVSYYVHSLLSEAISKRGYKVVFSGTAADELVTGYYDHFLLHLYEMRNDPDYQTILADWQKHIQPLIRNPFLKDPEIYQKDINFRKHIYLDKAAFADTLKVNFNEDFCEKKFCDSLLRNRMLNELFEEGTAPILHEDDLNSMYYSLENRTPYLDTNLFNFCYSIPPKHLIKDGYAKYILRQAMQGILNDKVRLDRTKKGFNASINTLVDFNAPETRAYLFDDSPIFDLVDKEKVMKLLEPNPLRDSMNLFAFSFINAKMFLEEHR